MQTNKQKQKKRERYQSDGNNDADFIRHLLWTMCMSDEVCAAIKKNLSPSEYQAKRHLFVQIVLDFNNCHKILHTISFGSAFSVKSLNIQIEIEKSIQFRLR